MKTLETIENLSVKQLFLSLDTQNVHIVAAKTKNTVTHIDLTTGEIYKTQSGDWVVTKPSEYYPNSSKLLAYLKKQSIKEN